MYEETRVGTVLSKSSFKFFEVLAFSLLFIASIRRVFLAGPIFLSPHTFEKVAVEVAFWIIAVAIFLWFTIQNRRLSEFILLGRLNWPVILFIGIATLSLTWTVYIPVTLYKIIALLASTTAAIYVGANLDLDDFVNKLAWFSAIVAALSFLMSVALPEVGIHQGHPYYGAWHGIFWTRGRMGSFMAFANLVFLFQVVRLMRLPKLLVVNVMFYLLTLALVFLTRSATSIILIFVLHFAFLAAWLWSKFRDQLTRAHYIGFGIFGLVMCVAVLTNLEFLFGLLGRETNLTGRVPMWGYLLSEVFVQKPVLGYGFATIWDHDNFRLFMQSVVGWPYPVLIADNGFLDILLNLGVVGELAFLAVFILAFVRAFKFSLRRGSSLNFFPLLLMIYALVLNLTLSHFFELEFFVWYLVASVLFLTTPRDAR